ncbi:hypothetical protein Mp_8g07590 [Marchantia polymorpha subsp. ruderalis]|uniref:Uncharacterized protein n=1 Tax=Marchantia polymorpha TaxID=3197 RepID=A0A2R6XI61_MARPO|nr:hypothetical protein MARPO_0013s0034 [Marchantia polymorpha]PTQ45796.1 hypothetical protein MARPO_0013s0034 [Marchantia polymorpha]BBN19061.1 hypothetical protein Mp_8g07590 [Marchantia polymorpha subsp. ruderalis]BBN19062.1 hypothetical protein Mp_8g07590 [Marchantia polymorpha subsp. ruderalis]|eukprot:PTQ45795.1 hypothetical protein MARPO_0013s0034 [Marchantia polymorpha]
MADENSNRDPRKGKERAMSGDGDTRPRSNSALRRASESSNSGIMGDVQPASLEMNSLMVTLRNRGSQANKALVGANPWTQQSAEQLRLENMQQAMQASRVDQAIRQHPNIQAANVLARPVGDVGASTSARRDTPAPWLIHLTAAAFSRAEPKAPDISSRSPARELQALHLPRACENDTLVTPEIAAFIKELREALTDDEGNILPRGLAALYRERIVNDEDEVEPSVVHWFEKAGVPLRWDRFGYRAFIGYEPQPHPDRSPRSEEEVDERLLDVCNDAESPPMNRYVKNLRATMFDRDGNWKLENFENLRKDGLFDDDHVIPPDRVQDLLDAGIPLGSDAEGRRYLAYYCGLTCARTAGLGQGFNFWRKKRDSSRSGAVHPSTYRGARLLLELPPPPDNLDLAHLDHRTRYYICLLKRGLIDEKGQIIAGGITELRRCCIVSEDGRITPSFIPWLRAAEVPLVTDTVTGAVRVNDDAARMADLSMQEQGEDRPDPPSALNLLSEVCSQAARISISGPRQRAIVANVAPNPADQAGTGAAQRLMNPIAAEALDRVTVRARGRQWRDPGQPAADPMDVEQADTSASGNERQRNPVAAQPRQQTTAARPHTTPGPGDSERVGPARERFLFGPDVPGGPSGAEAAGGPDGGEEPERDTVQAQRAEADRVQLLLQQMDILDAQVRRATGRGAPVVRSPGPPATQNAGRGRAPDRLVVAQVAPGTAVQAGGQSENRRIRKRSEDFPQPPAQFRRLDEAGQGVGVDRGPAARGDQGPVRGDPAGRGGGPVVFRRGPPGRGGQAGGRGRGRGGGGARGGWRAGGGLGRGRGRGGRGGDDGAGPGRGGGYQGEGQGRGRGGEGGGHEDDGETDADVEGYGGDDEPLDTQSQGLHDARGTASGPGGPVDDDSDEDNVPLAIRMQRLARERAARGPAGRGRGGGGGGGGGGGASPGAGGGRGGGGRGGGGGGSPGGGGGGRDVDGETDGDVDIDGDEEDEEQRKVRQEQDMAALGVNEEEFEQMDADDDVIHLGSADPPVPRIVGWGKFIVRNPDYVQVDHLPPAIRNQIPNRPDPQIACNPNFPAWSDRLQPRWVSDVGVLTIRMVSEMFPINTIISLKLLRILVIARKSISNRKQLYRCRLNIHLKNSGICVSIRNTRDEACPCWGVQIGQNRYDKQGPILYKRAVTAIVCDFIRGTPQHPPPKLSVEHKSLYLFLDTTNFGHILYIS